MEERGGGGRFHRKVLEKSVFSAEFDTCSMNASMLADAEKVISEFLSIARTDLKVIKRIRRFPRASKSYRAISGIDD